MAERGSIAAEEAPAEDVFALDEDGRIPFEGKVPLLTAPKAVSSVLNAVPESLTSNDDLLHDLKLAMSAREVEDGGQYSLGDTFWQPANSSDPPGHGLEALALAIFKHYAKDVSYDPEKSGAEWWTQVIDCRDDIGVHFDRDYGMEDYGLNVHPHVATVTYFSDTGAPTIVVPHVSGQSYGEDYSGSADSAHFSFPSAGKHLAFDGRYIHAASGDLKPPEHKGLRRTFLCNVWLNHEPMNSEPMPDEYNHQMKYKKVSMEGLDFSSAQGPTVVDASGPNTDPFSMKFVMDDHHGTFTLPVSGPALLSAAAGKGNLVELTFGDKKVEIVKGEEVVEGEDEESDDDDDEVSLGSKDTDEEDEEEVGSPKPPKRQKTE